MGKVEKLVVLTVLFLTAVVIAFTLRKGDGDKLSEQSNPLDGARKTVMDQVASADSAGVPAQNPLVSPPSSEPRFESAGESAGASPGTRNEPVLSAGVSPSGSAVAPPGPAPMPAARAAGLVKNAAGLRSGLTADLMLYDWQTGDTWASVAQHVYGESRYEAILRAANEGLRLPKPGDPILVPTNDLGKTPAGARSEMAKPGDTPVPSQLGAASPALLGGERVHVVKSGDSLSSISKKCYGTTTRWKEIAEANKSVLKDPNKLKVGMKLRIP